MTGDSHYVDFRSGHWVTFRHQAINNMPGCETNKKNNNKIKMSPAYAMHMARIRRLDALKTSLIDIAQQSAVGRFMILALDSCTPYTWQKRCPDELMRHQRKTIRNKLGLD